MGHLVRCKANMRDSFRGCEAYSAGSLCPAPVYTYAYGWDDKETPWLTVSQTPEASTLCSVYVCVGDGLEFTGKRQPAIKYLQQLSLKLLDQVWWPHKICQPSGSWTLSPRHCLLSPGATFSRHPFPHWLFLFQTLQSTHLWTFAAAVSSPWNRLPSALHFPQSLQRGWRLSSIPSSPHPHGAPPLQRPSHLKCVFHLLLPLP